MTDDKERELVAAFLMLGGEYSYEDTVAVRTSVNSQLGIVSLVDDGLLQVATRDGRWEADRYRLTPGAIQRFKGE